MISSVATVSTSVHPVRGPNFRRNHFHALFEQQPLDQPQTPAPKREVAKIRTTFSPAGAEVRSSRSEQDWHETTRSAAAVTSESRGQQNHHTPAPESEFSWLSPSIPISLEPLQHALREAGLNPDSFQFEQVEARQAFPTRPDLDFLTQQIIIRGPNGVGLFDRGLALRTPWVTAAELRRYGIA